MRKFTSLVLLSIISIPTFALQMKSAVNNETITAKISSTDLTRIVVQGDRIKNARGVKGAYTRENDNNNGEIYIQPTPFFQNQAFTILIDTELGRHYILLLNPMSVPSDTLMLVPTGVGSIEAERFEKASPYELTITHLINALLNGRSVEGYEIRQIDNKKIYMYGNIASLKLKTIYQGLNLQGEVWEVTNKQNYTITLNERAFYKEGTRAVSLETLNIPPHGKINLYRVNSNA